jgi:molybdate transport system substrate-binding protein
VRRSTADRGAARARPQVHLALAALLALAGGACAAGGSAADADADHTSVTVAAASDLQFALRELIDEFETVAPGVRVEAVFGSSGNLVGQIRNGAPFDVFVSADIAYARDVEAAGLAEPGSTRRYAIGALALWVPDGSPLDVKSRGLEALTDPAAARIAIANPEHAPYGRAAVAAMQAAGVYDTVRDRLVLGENVSQAAQFVESGSADVGIVALSIVRAPTLDGVGTFAEVPTELYPPIEQGVVVLDRATDRAAAESFVAFVLSDAGRPVLGRYGFGAPGD